MTQITSTHDKTAFLREHMLRPFCLKWPAFASNCDRFGAEQVLTDYAEQFAGRGYVTTQIKKAINQALDGTYCPDPRTLQKMVENINKVEKGVNEFTKTSPEDHARNKSVMETLLTKNRDIRETIKATCPDFSNNPQNARNACTAYINQLTTALKAGTV